MENVRVVIILGSDSDLKIAADATATLEQFGIPNYITIASAHRTPARVVELIQKYETSGAKVFIAIAGQAAHLPGVIASYTTLPVIGVPIKSAAVEGLDALLSIVQMPAGIPVATVGINNAKNAALLAVSILAVDDKKLAIKLADYRKKIGKQVEEKAINLDKLGYVKYIKSQVKK
ncbi:MAG: 5-(carboxyamino)imidazole ribonucleotide mutase [Elusimicrobiota bacterium]